MILLGQTSIENITNERKYDMGKRKNWETLFGTSKFWMLIERRSQLAIPLSVI
jgi:hypothetical protein